METVMNYSKIKLLPFHPLVDLFPPMLDPEDLDELDEIDPNCLPEDFGNLIVDIQKHGLRNPIDTWNGQIIDGKHRALACKKLGIEPQYRERKFADEAGVLAYVISQNIHRRHMHLEQKRQLIAKLLKADPTQSDNSIAKQTKTTNKTVAAQRKRLEGRKEIPNVSKRTDTQGRQQPAKKASNPKVKPTAAQPDRVEPKVEATPCCSWCQHEITQPPPLICEECVEHRLHLVREPQSDEQLIERLFRVVDQMGTETRKRLLVLLNDKLGTVDPADDDYPDMPEFLVRAPDPEAASS
jgi:ParB-like nuclease domain